MFARVWPSSEALLRPRDPSDSYFEAAKSVWWIHDETLNIWSHLTAAALLLASTIRFIIRFYLCREASPTTSTWAIWIYLATATSCFFCSALHHTLSNHSQTAFWLRMDHFGITMFIWGSALSFSVLCFTNHRTTQRAYLGVLTLSMILSLSRLWQDTTHWTHPSRVVIFTHAAHGGLATVPALHFASRIRSRASKAEKRLFWSFLALVVNRTRNGTWGNA
ncbi:hypothetical protein EJ02DRAFT_486822 [Clathrospora elynae]|uniref:HlyIII-domain-containing protein n=1 Tax=Clathrospora elynae TaxID=706981 RepID=A0A6A5S376_9PLEO|nr:hypothetical protein EJ02DRAFT_486822 [Clathrospora elynae]